MSTSPDKKAFGERIKARREFLKQTDDRFTQSFVAKQLGVSRESYVAYENGRNSLAATELPKLARILGISTAYFYDEDATSPGSRMIVYEPIMEELRSASYDGGLPVADVSEIAEIIRMKARRKAERQGRA